MGLSALHTYLHMINKTMPLEGTSTQFWHFNCSKVKSSLHKWWVAQSFTQATIGQWRRDLFFIGSSKRIKKGGSFIAWWKISLTVKQTITSSRPLACVWQVRRHGYTCFMERDDSKRGLGFTFHIIIML